MVVVGRKSKPNASTAAVQAATCTANARAKNLKPPALILSMLSMATSSALGSRLNPIRATHTPPAPESMTRFRSSAR
jgi:hypothetical protein